MASDRNTEITKTIDRLLRERLEQFEIPSEVRIALRNDILAFFQRPEVKPFGAAVMTPEASIAADQARKSGTTQQPGTKTPEII